MFRTMDNVAVYDKADIDASLGIKPAGKSTAFEEISGLDTRVTRLEHDMVTKSEVTSLVSEAVDSIIDEKIAEVKPELEAEIDSIVDTALQDYDTSAAVDIKIAAVDTKIAAATTPMSSAEVIAVVDQYF